MTFQVSQFLSLFLHYCCSGVIPPSVRFLIFLIFFFGLRMLLWLWTDDPLLELPLLELLLYSSSSPSPALVSRPKGGCRSSSSSPLVGLAVSKVHSTMSSSATMPVWDPVLTCGVEGYLVELSGGSLLSCPFGRLAIGGSSNCAGNTCRRRCWPHSMKDLISSHSFRTQWGSVSCGILGRFRRSASTVVSSKSVLSNGMVVCQR